MKTLLKILAAVVLGVGLTTGLAAAGTGTIDKTGADSSNEIRFNDDVDTDIEAENETDAQIDVDQQADSGNADVNKNTEGGDAETGDAENDADVDADVESSNEGATDLANLGGQGSGDNDASIETTGFNSDNKVVFNNNYNLDVDLSNDTDVDVDVKQDARSGNATSSQNTEGGGASTGNARNSSTTSLSIKSTN